MIWLRLPISLAALVSSALTVLLGRAIGSEAYSIPACPLGSSCGDPRFKDAPYECDTATTPLRPGQADIIEFRCLDGHCISVEGLRNGFKNCNDGSDEEAPSPKDSRSRVEDQSRSAPSPASTASVSTSPSSSTTGVRSTTAAVQTTTTVTDAAMTTTFTTTSTTWTTLTSTSTSLSPGPELQNVRMTAPGCKGRANRDEQSGFEPVLYTGPVDTKGRAHGTGQYKCDDGGLFLGIFSRGEMKAGVLYSPSRGRSLRERRPRMTIVSGHWTHGIDASVVRAFPIESTFVGPLRVRIESAHNMENSDWLDKSDCFVEGFFYGALSMEFQTEEVANSLNPVWGYSVILPKVEVDDKLVLKVRDRDSWESDDHLGHAVLRFGQVPTTRQLGLSGHDQAFLNVKVEASSDPAVRGVVGGPCNQYSLVAGDSNDGSLEFGLRFCKSKNRRDTSSDIRSIAPWGSIVHGLDAGNGWVMLCQNAHGSGDPAEVLPSFLPMRTHNGEALLVPYRAFDVEIPIPPMDSAGSILIEGPSIPIAISAPAPLITTTTETTQAAGSTFTEAVNEKTSGIDSWADSPFESRGEMGAPTRLPQRSEDAQPPVASTTTTFLTLPVTTIFELPTTTTTPVLDETHRTAGQRSTENMQLPPGFSHVEIQKDVLAKALLISAGVPLQRAQSEILDTATLKETDFMEALEKYQRKNQGSSRLLLAGDTVLVVSDLISSRSCEAPPHDSVDEDEVNALCHMAGVDIAPGISGTVLSTGPGGSRLIQFNAIGNSKYAQLVLSGQFDALAIDNNIYCEYNTIVVQKSFVPPNAEGDAGKLYRGETGSILDYTVDFINVSFATVKASLKIPRSDFGHIGCGAGENSGCRGSALVVLRDLTLDTGLELVAGQWGTLKGLDEHGGAIILFGGTPQSIPHEFLRFLGCLSEAPTLGAQEFEVEDLYQQLYQAPEWVTSLFNRVVPANETTHGTNWRPIAKAQEPVLLEGRRLRTADDPNSTSNFTSLFQGARAVAIPAWLRKLPSVEQKAQFPNDGCNPLEVVGPGDSLRVLFAIALVHLNFDPAKEDRMVKALMSNALRNLTGDAHIESEVRSGMPSIILGSISLTGEGQDADARAACARLRNGAKKQLQMALSRAEVQRDRTRSVGGNSNHSPVSDDAGSKSQRPMVVGGFFSVQAQNMRRSFDQSTEVPTYEFKGSLEGLEADIEQGTQELKERIRTRVTEGIAAAIGEKVRTQDGNINVRLDFARTSAAVSATVRLSTVREALQASTNLLAAGAAYVQAKVRPIAGKGVIAELTAGVVQCPLSTPHQSWFKDQSDDEQYGQSLYLALAGVKRLDTLPRSLPEVQTDGVSDGSADALAWGSLFSDEYAPSDPYPLGPHPQKTNAPPEIDELGPSAAVPYPPLPPLPPWPLQLTSEEDLFHEEEETEESVEADSALVPWAPEPIDIFNLTETLQCSCKDVTYEPLDMPGAGPTKEITIAACQARCALTKGCATYAYWLSGGICHLQNAFAYRSKSRFGFISGPAGCKTNQESLLLLEIQLKKNTCFELEKSSLQMDMAGTTPHAVDSVLDCQECCAKTCGCTRFVYNAYSGICHLTTNQTDLVPSTLYYVTGPPICNEPMFFSFIIMNLCYDCVADRNRLMFRLETAIRTAVSAQTCFNVTIRSIGVVMRPYKPTWRSSLDAPSHHLFVQVLVWPPTSMTTAEVNATLNSTVSLVRRLEASIRRVPLIHWCKKGFMINVVHATVPQPVEDITLSRGQREAKRQYLKQLNDPGQKAAGIARKQQWALDGSSMDEVKPNLFDNGEGRYSSTAAFFIVFMIACTSAGFVGATGGLALVRSLASRQRRRPSASLDGLRSAGRTVADECERHGLLQFGQAENRHGYPSISADTQVFARSVAMPRPSIFDSGRRPGCVSAVEPNQRPRPGALASVLDCAAMSAADCRRPNDARELTTDVILRDPCIVGDFGDLDGGDVSPPSDSASE